MTKFLICMICVVSLIGVTRAYAVPRNFTPRAKRARPAPVQPSSEVQVPWALSSPPESVRRADGRDESEYEEQPSYRESSRSRKLEASKSNEDWHDDERTKLNNAFSASLLLGYGALSGYRFGLGLRAGYRVGFKSALPMAGYFGGTFIYHLGNSQAVEYEGGSIGKRSGNVFYMGGEAGLEFQPSSIVFRPYIGMGAAVVNITDNSGTEKASKSVGQFALWLVLP